MRTNARMGAHALTLVVLTALVGLPERAEAQQQGLFPLAPIRRQRVPCDQEDPTYKIYKSQYFGYHPTCWNPFPAGWGCPSTQAPNRAQSLKETPPARESGTADRGLFDEDGGRGEPAPRRRAEPLPLPGDTNENVFDPNSPATGAIPGAPVQPGAGTPPATRPFDANPRGAMRLPSRGRSRARVRTAEPPAEETAPELAEPSGAVAERSSGRRGRESAEDDGGPLLGLADSDIVRSDTTSVDQPPAEVAENDSTPPAPAPAPPAPQRRRLFGNLFSALSGGSIRR